MKALKQYLLIVLIIFQFLSCKQLPTEKNNHINEIKFNKLYNNEIYRLVFNFSQVNDVMLRDGNFMKKKMSQSLSQKKVLLIQFTDIGCFSCLEQFLTIASSQKFKYPIILIAPYGYRRKLLILIKELKLNAKIYDIGKQYLFPDLDSIVSPYLGIINSNLIIKNLFIPDKLFPERNEKYLEMCRNIFRSEIDINDKN